MSKKLFSVVVVLSAVALVGCATSMSNQHTTILPASRIESMQSFYVMNRPGDERNLEREIAEQLIELGFRATSGSGEPEDPVRFDAIVTYIDRYMWDMSTYCLQLTLFVRDTQTGFITATGSSWRPSLERKTPGGHAKLLLTDLLGRGS